MTEISTCHRCGEADEELWSCEDCGYDCCYFCIDSCCEPDKEER